MKKNVILLLVLLISYTGMSQIKLKTDAILGGGFEENIFKAPDVLLMPNNVDFYDVDSIIISDVFLDFGYSLDVEYKLNKKNVFEVYHKLSNRRYINNSSLNQFGLEFGTNYEYRINKDFSVGANYELSRSKKIGTTVLGDELTSVFSYMKNNAEVYLYTDFFNYNETTFSLNYYNKS